MSAMRMILGVALATTLGLACAQLGVVPSARFKVNQPFVPREGESNTLGVNVVAALPAGTLSAENLKRLSGWISVGLMEGSMDATGRFDRVIDMKNDGNQGNDANLILTVEISVLEAATQAEEKKQIPSHLHAKISLRSRATGKNMGSASIWAVGSELNLASNNRPRIVTAFINAIRESMQQS